MVISPAPASASGAVSKIIAPTCGAPRLTLMPQSSSRVKRSAIASAASVTTSEISM